MAIKPAKMEYAEILKKYGDSDTVSDMDHVLSGARREAEGGLTSQELRLCYSCLDLTSLEPTDSENSITSFVEKAVSQTARFPDIPNFASICVYPSFVETVGIALGDSDIRIASVAGGFPAAQTFLEVKMLEAAMAVENGADEIDMVLSPGEILSEKFAQAGSELETVREEIGSDVILKVIIESGVLPDVRTIRKAALTAMIAGADFVKTSTGKVAVGATPEATVVICRAISDYYHETGHKIGFKVAGGVRTVADVALYYNIVRKILGEEWLNPSLFRIGASSAANNLLSEMIGKTVKYY